MKIRAGFVSNSSSSSFVVIGERMMDLENIKTAFSGEHVITFGNCGETEFGWQERRYSDVWSRINFAYLQTLSVGGDIGERWLEMLEDVIRDAFELKEKQAIDWVISESYDREKKHSVYGEPLVWGYIDHASAACESENIEMFKNKEELKAFLFCEDSYIQCDNDNH